MEGASQSAKIAIVGIGDDGAASLTEAARRRIHEADVVFGTRRALSLVEDGPSDRRIIGGDLAELVRILEELRPSKRIVLLTSGDPLFYGVARYLSDRLGKDAFEVVPHVSTMQLAFARVMESWDEAYLTDLARHSLESVVERIRTAEKAGLFTTEHATPATVAKALLGEGIDYFRVFVCENLGARNEVVTQGSLAEIAAMEFSPLNVMILVRRQGAPDQPRPTPRLQLFGNPDELFRQSRPKRGLLTPAEIRMLALGVLDVRTTSVVWDVGAGSGSISVEAAQLAREGKVHAIEPDAEDCVLIRDNASTFAVKNVEVVQGYAPDVFAGLPDPDRVFVGGVGRETTGILGKAYARLAPGGRLVANLGSLEGVATATATLRQLAGHVGVLMVNLARGTHQLESIRFEAHNPSFLVSVEKPLG